MSPTNKQAIVTFASRNSNYINGMARLAESLRDRFEGSFISFTDEASIGSPLHSENPYAFKLHALKTAINAGYTKLLWLDCSVYAIANVQPIFDIISEQGYFFQDSGWTCDEWTNKETLANFKTDGVGIPMFSSGVTGFDIHSKVGLYFYQMWWQAMNDGMFKGDWENHRHDQSAGSLIAHSLGMKPFACNEYYSYKCENLPITDKTVFLLEGM